MAKKNRINRSTSAAASPMTQFNPDYTHIRRDLARIGILAGIFFTALIVLSFFLK